MKTLSAKTTDINRFKTRDIGQLKIEVAEYLRALGYTERTISLHQCVWQRLSKFAKTEKNTTLFTQELNIEFLKTEGIFTDRINQILSNRQVGIRTATRILSELVLHGTYRRSLRKFAPASIPDSWQKYYSAYCKYCLDEGIKETTMRVRKSNLSKFVKYLDDRGINAPKKLTHIISSDYMKIYVDYASETLALLATDIRSFYKYLFMIGVIDEQLSETVPRVRIYRKSRIPEVWSEEEIECLLKAVDRGSPMGKRDYAILLLASRLGMRASDIRKMQLKHILWESNRIELIQSKTGEPLSLPLTPEIGNAIIDYLKNGRPITEYREIFLKSIAPFEPLSRYNNLHTIITRYRIRAGIRLKHQERKGLHVLRHSLASRLLEKKTPIETIASILGHIHVESTMVYSKIDINALRSATIEMEVD